MLSAIRNGGLFYLEKNNLKSAISHNGFGINEVAEGIAKQYRETISCIPCYAMSRPEGVASITGIISEAVMAKGSDRRERFRHKIQL